MSKQNFSTDFKTSLPIFTTMEVKVITNLDDLNISKQDQETLSDIVKQTKQLQQKPETESSTSNLVLFWGDDRSNKLSAAAIIASKSDRQLYRIDLRKVISKYIGETEKNLSYLFDKAANKDWILFFDEADALFGKRTGVKDSHDKYANQEVSFLMQRLEDYPGLVILATNYKNNIDDAFLRQIRFELSFPKPEAKPRENIWVKLSEFIINLLKKKGYVTVMDVDGSKLKENKE